ncbi:MAG: DUF3078 domain-containing protein [Bacteroidales bacterium]|nr:DUF3078 domain-containing protein [Bacteroidales bacterium]
MKHLVLTLAAVAFTLPLLAQTDEVAKDVASLANESTATADVDSGKVWKFSGMLSLTASQTSLVNWAPGGDQQIGLNALANFNANYHKNKHSWQNAITAQYGTLRLIDEYDEFRKNDDKLQFSSKYGYQAAKKLYYSAILDYKSQFDKGWTYEKVTETNADGVEEEVEHATLNSECWSPLYLTYTIGIDYQLSENCTFYLSPLCGKTTVVLNDFLSEQAAFGVDTCKHARSEFGWYFKLDAKYDIAKNISVGTNLVLFNSYKDGFMDEIDVDWNVIIAMQINKWLAFNVTSELVYDEDVKVVKDDREYFSLTQFKNVMGLGLTFKF